MKKRRIVLASLLKPVNDPRMCEKIGMSLAQSGQYEVHIIGYPSGTQVSESNVHFHELPLFKRISIGRIGARLKAIQIVIKLKPELFIITTPDLLGVAILIRILFGAKIIYDIQENYWRNILFTNAFRKPVRPFIAAVVRLKEWMTSPFFSQFLLAEKCYSNELGFIKNKYLVIENKCKIPNGFQRKPCKNFIQLIFTGTLAESTGVFQAIDLAKKLHSIEPKIRLNIIGYCALANVLYQIKQAISENQFIALIGGNESVSHQSIMNSIASANFGIINYPHSPHTENKIPTKLYEYLACQLPILLQGHKPWTEMCAPYNAAIIIDFREPDTEFILNKIRAGGFYSKNPEGMIWQSEEGKLLSLIDSIF